MNRLGNKMTGEIQGVGGDSGFESLIYRWFNGNITTKVNKSKVFTSLA